MVLVRVRVMSSKIDFVNRTMESRRILLRLLPVMTGAVLLAGCTSDTSRLAENPFGAADRTSTGSTAKPSTSNSWLPPADVSGAVQQVSAPPQMSAQPNSSIIQSSPLPPVANPGFAAPAAASPRLASPGVSAPMSTGVSRNAAVSGNWSAEGGTSIVAAQGETADILSSRYGVPASALLAVNNMKSASEVQPGKRLIIPVYSANPGKVLPAAKAAAAPASRPEKLTLVKGAQAKSGGIDKPVKASEKAARAAEKPVKTAALPPAETSRKPAAANAEAAKPAKAAMPEAAAPADPEPTASVPAADTASKPEFRWPARGRIIQGFKKGTSDGINIAVPEGTSVKAAEAGVVAYAGSELKGYGNLVLIRHPNGYVSAYAHNGEINVKRGEQIRRGQQIAKSGKSGNVSSPQIHFELRKGSTPVDPTEYLAGL